MPASWSIASAAQTAQTCQLATTSHLAAASTAKLIPATTGSATTPATATRVSTETIPEIKPSTTRYLCGVAVCKISVSSGLSLRSHTQV